MTDNDVVHGTVGVRIAPGSVAVGLLPAGPDPGAATPLLRSAALEGLPGSQVWDAQLTQHLDGLLDPAWPEPLHGSVLDIGPVLDAVLRPGAGVRLGRVTTVRIAPALGPGQQPLLRWPQWLRDQVDGGWVHLVGGTDLLGRSPHPIDTSVLDAALRTADAQEADVIAVAAVGALLESDTEFAVAEYLVRHTDRPVVLSHEVGGRRYMERENAAILNAALLGPAGRLLDLVAQASPGLRLEDQSVLRADGSRIGREEARLFPWSLVDTVPAALAQGAAALVGTDTALVLVWSPERARLLTLEGGVLRAHHFRSLPDVPDVRVAQRHAAHVSVRGTAPGQHLSSDLLGGDQSVLLVPGTPPDRSGWSAESRADFERYAAELVRQVPEAVALDEDLAGVCALGAAIARAQSEVVRFAVVEDIGDLGAQRNLTRELARGRVLSAVGAPAEQVTIADQASPLSFLNSGPVLIRVQVVGTTTGGVS
ncbi:hypothetical protein [Ornithinimicrobium cavernae]|uniref:hypothetical protein n=1 Tax=Ornithinimicrobium cavernae TaxID=2666047 RepID=UPI00137B045A|nr:hypothetical protein [Ornithinimicrobium cavernae]